MTEVFSPLIKSPVQLTLDPDNTVVISDLHYGHANIIGYCDRPYETVEEMNVHLWNAMVEADTAGKVILFLGDLHFHTEPPPLEGSERHIMLMGNHDKQPKRHYAKWFHTILGHRKQWREFYVEAWINGVRIALSHAPLPLPTTTHCKQNWHGHVHDRSLLDPWHVNCSVEALNYTPRSARTLLGRYGL